MALELSTTKENFTALLTKLGEDLARDIRFEVRPDLPTVLDWRDSSGALMMASLTIYRDRPLLILYKGQDIDPHFLDWEFARDMGVVREA